MQIRKHLTRKTALKVIFYQVIALSLALNLLQFRTAYAIRCAGTAGQIMAYMVTREKCDELVTDYIDARVYRTSEANNVAAAEIDAQREDANAN